MIRTQEQHLAHYGVKRRSGRYPWGSGGNAPETTRSRNLLADIEKLKQQNPDMSEAQLAKGLGMKSVTELRAEKSIEKDRQRQEKILTAMRLEEKGYKNTEIGKIMGLNESSVRALLQPGQLDKADATQTTAKALKEELVKKEMIDVSKGVEVQMGVTRTRLDTAIKSLEKEGYNLYKLKIGQVTSPGQFTRTKVLTNPKIPFDYVTKNRDKIEEFESYSIDHGRSFFGTKPPLSVNPNRLRINYADTGGKELDGVIYVRPNKKDLHLENDRYGQVRVKIGDGHYIKGMAIYNKDLFDKLPPGVDLVFNTNKENTGRKVDAMKPLETKHPDLPFGAIVRQIHDKEGNVTSALNIVGVKEGSGVEGSWDKWSRTLSSQMLSKQDPTLAKRQLDMTYQRRLDTFREINSLTNPTVKKELLNKFADSTDAASVHLKAANLPRQATKVLLPIPSMKDNEVYAPGMVQGERVALIRFPHGGKFEIPNLIVNNRNPEARRLIGTGGQRKVTDAIGINHNVAHHLSGADFDGDTVLVIPNNRGLVKHDDPLDELKTFDPQVYKIPKGSSIPEVKVKTKNSQMGRVSNLITDMTIAGASTDEVARAVKHSMVVIDSEKHQLNWKQSEIDHGIPALKQKYQGSKKAGAQTIVSRRKGQVRIAEREPRSAREGGPVDPRTGRKIYVPTGRTIPETKVRTIAGKKVKVATGRQVPAEKEFKRLEVLEDAYDIFPPGHEPKPMEILYADHSNRLKALANEARKTALPLKGTPQSRSAKTAYKNEVASLKSKLDNAKRNAPRERHAQRLAGTQVSAIRRANPDLEKAEVTKIKQQTLATARARTNAKKDMIKITQEEWNAIQAGAISNHMLTEILKNSDSDTVTHLALPKHVPKMTSTKLLRAQTMLESGYTQADVAAHLGVSLSTLKLALNE